MREVTNKTSNVTKIDIMNCNNSTALKDTEKITVHKAVIGKDISAESGEIVDVGYLIATDGSVYGTISESAIRFIETLIDIMTDDDCKKSYIINVKLDKSSKGREFLRLWATEE